jgi:RNA polymerase sigma-70 factor (ECF subfamily)
MPKFESKDKDFDIFTMIKDSSYNVEKQIITDQISSDVRKLLDKLPDDQKQVVYMRLFKDMSFKEIAENTNVSINTSLGRMRYAIINLRRLIEKHNIILTE